MLDAARDDYKFAGVQVYLAIAQLDKQVPGDDQEEFVLLLMMMPDKFSLQFDELDVRIVQLAYNFRTPGIVKLREFFGQAYFFDHVVFSFASGSGRGQALPVPYDEAGSGALPGPAP